MKSLKLASKEVIFNDWKNAPSIHKVKRKDGYQCVIISHLLLIYSLLLRLKHLLPDIFLHDMYR